MISRKEQLKRLEQAGQFGIPKGTFGVEKGTFSIPKGTFGVPMGTFRGPKESLLERFRSEFKIKKPIVK